MKKQILFLLATVAFCLNVNAQLDYDSNGKLTLGTPQADPLAQINLQSSSFKLVNPTGNNFFSINLTSASTNLYSGLNMIRFFNTNTDVYNSIGAAQFYQLSDESEKTDIKTVENGLQTILSLNPVTFKWKSQARSRSVGNKTASDEYGFLAQEVESVLPSAVSTDEEGRKLVNYSAVIPIMVEAIQTLQAEVARLSAAPMQTRSAQGLDEAGAEAIELSQNVPNPFNVSTDIHFTIPQTVQQARLFVYNLQGNQLKNMLIGERGKGKVTINANELTPGMYIYALIADGKEVASKRMILTD